MSAQSFISYYTVNTVHWTKCIVLHTVLLPVGEVTVVMYFETCVVHPYRLQRPEVRDTKTQKTRKRFSRVHATVKTYCVENTNRRVVIISYLQHVLY